MHPFNAVISHFIMMVNQTFYFIHTMSSGGKIISCVGSSGINSDWSYNFWDESVELS